MSSKWHEKELEEVLHTVRGISFPKESRRDELEDGYIACLRTTNVQENVEWGDLFYAPIERVKRDEQYLQSGDILMSTANSLDLLGKVAFVASLPQKATLGTFILCLRAKSINEVSKFYYYQLKGQEFLNQVRRNAKTTTNISNISATQLKKLKLKAVDRDIQERITQKLDSLFSKIDAGEEGLKEVEKQLEMYRQAALKGVFDGSFSRSLVKQDLLISPIEEILYDSNDVPYNIPKNWRWVKFVDIGELGRGKSKHRPRNDKRLFGGKYPFIQTGEVRKARKWLKKYSKTYSEFGLAQSRLWPKGTLLITIAANIADTAILEIDACFPDSVVGFIPKENICNVEYIEFFIRTIKDRLETFAPATAQKNINLRILNDVYIPLPPLEEQKMIVESVNKLMSISYVVEETIQKSRLISKNLKQSTLKKTFNGELIT